MNKILLSITLIFLFSCDVVQETELHKTKGNLIFFNGLATTLSILDIYEEKTYNNVRTTGYVPNYLYYDYDLLITNSGDNNIYIMDIDTLNVKKVISLGESKRPWMCFPIDGSDYIYVTCYDSDSVIKLNRKTGEILQEISVHEDDYDKTKNSPEGGVIVGNRLFIADSTIIDSDNIDGISVINLETDTLEKYIELEITVNRDIWNTQSLIAFDNTIHIVCSGRNTGATGESDGAILVMDTSTYEITDIVEIGGSPVYSEGGLDTTRELVYLSSSNGILCYNYTTLEIIDTGITGRWFSGLYYLENTNKIYASAFDDDRIYIYNGDDFSYEKSLEASDGPQQLLYIKE